MRSVFVTTVALLVTAMGTAGCVGRPYRIPQVQYDASQYQNLGSTSTKTTGLMLLDFIPINLNNKIERAIRTGIQQKGGDVMVDVDVKESWFWAWVLNGYQTTVSGTVLKKK